MGGHVDTALIVFTVGTAASFLPLYWLAIRISSRWNRRAAAAAATTATRAEPPGRREFLELLRREAANRAVAVLHEALVEARLTTDHGSRGSNGISIETRLSLAETGRLVDSLFARDLREKFRQGAEALATASASTIGAASVASTSAISAFERALEGEPERAAAARRPSGWGGLISKGRGLVGVGGVRAAA
jgi:acetoin utilization deacetylase AcuC-like enzyme